MIKLIDLLTESVFPFHEDDVIFDEMDDSVLAVDYVFETPDNTYTVTFPDKTMILMMIKQNIPGIVPFVTSHLMGRFFVFFIVTFLLFPAAAGGSNPVGQSPNPI